MESQASPTEQPAGLVRGFTRRPGEHWTRFATRIANAYGIVLLLVVAIYVLASLVYFRGWGAVALTAVTAACTTVALVSSDARPPLPRLSIAVGSAAFALAVASAFGSSGKLL